MQDLILSKTELASLNAQIDLLKAKTLLMKAKARLINARAATQEEENKKNY